MVDCDFFNFSILFQEGVLRVSVMEVVGSGEGSHRQASQGKKYILKFVLEPFHPNQMT